MAFKSYPKGAAMTEESSFLRPIVAVNADWVLKFGGLSQRRRLARAMNASPTKKSAQAGRKK
jgi:hypothetical protein